MTRGARGRGNISGARGREVLDGPRTREILEGGRSRQVLTGPRGRIAGGVSYPDVLDEATLWLDSQYSVTREPRAINRGTGGAVLDAKYGSVLGAYVYDGAAVLPGIVSNFLSVPDAAALDITGDIEIVVRARLNDWSNGTQVLVAKQQSGTQRSYYFELDSAGRPILYLSFDGAAQVGNPGTAPPFADGTTYWLKVTRNGSSGLVSYFYAADQDSEPTSWTATGTTSLASTAIYSSTSIVSIGERQSFGSAAGSVHRAIVRNGIDGTTVLDVDLANVADYATSFTAVTGQTVTVNSTSSDTNDPLLLTHTGENYAYFPGLAGNTMQTTTEAGPTSGQVVTLEYEYATVQTARDGTLTQRTTSPSKLVWWVNHTVGGSIAVNVAGAGGTTATSISPSESFTGGPGRRNRIVLDPLGSGTAEAFLSDDGGPWRSVGSVNIMLGLFTDWNGTTSPFGHGTDGLPILGALKSAKVSYDSEVVYDFNAATDITSAGATSFTATSGQTVTVARATSGRKTALVTRPIWLFGTDDFLEVADNDLLDFGVGEDFTVVAVLRRWVTPSSNPSIVMKSSLTTVPGTPGWGLYGNGVALGVKVLAADGTVVPNVGSVAPSAGQLTLGRAYRDATLDVIGASVNDLAATTTTDTTTASLANANVLRVGSYNSTVAGNADMECVAVAVWRRVLTVDEIAAINTYYGTA